MPCLHTVHGGASQFIFVSTLFLLHCHLLGTIMFSSHFQCLSLSSKLIFSPEISQIKDVIYVLGGWHMLLQNFGCINNRGVKKK